MQRFKFHRGETGIFGEQHVRLVYDQYSLLPFINRVHSDENLFKLAESRKHVDRELLQKVLRDQYKEIGIRPAVARSIDRLEDKKTFTITTGHQLSLFTGPLYFVIKILDVLKQCALLNESDSEYNFVPVFWMASEDHDFEEVATTHLFNRSLKWETDQKGAVGRFELDEAFRLLKKEFGELFNENHDEITQLLNAYEGKNLAAATRGLVDALFGDKGLVIIDGDDTELKRSFLPVIEKELSERPSLEAVEKTNLSLQREGLGLQVKPRQLNFFYLDDHMRSGIDVSGDKFTIHQVGDFSKEEIIDLARIHPERFSPNVVLRPVYQEYILPNLMYVGGGGEISYWLQLKGVFESFDVDYPMIRVRNSVMWIDAITEKKISKLNLPLQSLFRREEEIKKEYIEANESEVLDDEALTSALEVLKGEILDYVMEADPSLEQYARAEGAKIDKQVDAIRSKVVRAAKAKHDTAMGAISAIRSRLFPENELQERYMNFFHFCAEGNVYERLEQLYSSLDPYEPDLIVIREC